jgi:hypothetical protein
MKKSSSTAADGSYQPLRICFERILPGELDTGRGTRHAIRDLVAKQEHGKAYRGLPKAAKGRVTRMALSISKKWPPGSVLRCGFLDGTKKMRSKVEKFAHMWESYESVRFKFGKAADAQIRISFYADDGSWSALGTDALNAAYFPPGQATMNFGWLREDTADAEWRRVVLHEFGHALGCVHEHESPSFTRQWDRAAVYKAYMGKPNEWTKAEIDSNVLDKYSADGISATGYDPKSIMLYDFPAELFTDGLGPTNFNTRLSAKDRKKIGEMYPKR